MNSVFFGENAYGVKAAAQEYFGKDLDELTIAEAAALVAPIRNPTFYDPRRFPDERHRGPKPSDRRDGRQRLHHPGRRRRSAGRAARHHPPRGLRGAGARRSSSRRARSSSATPSTGSATPTRAKAGPVRLPGGRHRVRGRWRPQDHGDRRLRAPGGGQSHPPGVVPAELEGRPGPSPWSTTGPER